MIHTIRTVAVGDQESKIDSPIILYRGDREVEVEFTINGSKFTFTNGGNVIKSTNATHGQLVINTPTGENMFSEVTECHDGKVVFVITKEMIDELIEVGFYSFQIRLFDESQISRVTIPPVLKGIDIRNPIAAEDETNVVDIGLVDYAVVVKDEFEDLSTFLPDGNYNKTEWESKDVISGAKLNKIEDALYNINSDMEATDLALLNRIERISNDVIGNRLDADSRLDALEDVNADNRLNALESVSSQLEQITINVKDFGAVGDGVTDDSNAFKSAIEYANSKNSYLTIPNDGVGYLLKQNIQLPYGLKIISNGAKVILNCQLILDGMNTIENLIIDGNWNTKGIIIKGNNCIISNNEFLNIKNNSSNYYGLTIGIDIENNVENTTIKNNIFNGLACYIEGSETENYRTARFIRVKYSPNTLIQGNIFKGSTTITDTDYVHFQSSSNTIKTNERPFSTGYYYIPLYGCVLTNNVFYQNHCKCCVKVQASGITISENKFIVDDTLLPNDYCVVIRVYSSVGCDIINNEIVCDSENMSSSIFTTSEVTNVVLKGNVILDNRKNAHTTIYFSDASHCVFNNNIVRMNHCTNSSYGIYIRGCEHLKVCDNDITILSNNSYAGTNNMEVIYMQNSGLGDSYKTENILISNNRISQDAYNPTNRCRIYSNSQLKDIQIINNIFEVETQIYYTSIDTFTFNNNYIRCSIAYPFTIGAGSGSNTIQSISNNTFDVRDASDNYVLIRNYATLTSITFANNTLINHAPGYNAQVIYGTQGSEKNLVYKPGGSLFDRMDYGSTNVRPTCNLQIGHLFFDRTLGYYVVWSGSEWLSMNAN